MSGPGRGPLDLGDERRGGALVLRPAGRIEGVRVSELREQFARRVDGGENRLVVDCAGVEHMASAGFRILLDLARRLDSRGGRLALCGLRAHLRAAARPLAGPAGPLELHDSVGEALGGR